MPKNTQTEFNILDSHGTKCHRWVSNIQITFVRKKFIAAIKPPKEKEDQASNVKAQVLMFLRRHMDKMLNNKWRSVCLLDFAKVHDYHQAILNLQADLNVCGKEKTGDDMIEKTLETFPESTNEIAHQYRLDYEAKRIKSFTYLMNFLKKKEHYHKIILNNNNLKLAGTKRVLEAN
ncbi:uncharacterized protein LOC126787284 [Argentina anserina]|uniref:uncharacterized protein LOC126787284 n=1 Tax=Argentina anserina TaxID=57926 RepID=UPI00217658AB|nr:uncharacterized protein LOC126787284 [Potentilla anserina]